MNELEFFADTQQASCSISIQNMAQPQKSDIKFGTVRSVVSFISHEKIAPIRPAVIE